MSTVKAYHHTWEWHGWTNKWYQAFPLPEEEKQKAIDIAKSKVEEKLYAHFQEEFEKKGIDVVITSIDINAWFHYVPRWEDYPRIVIEAVVKFDTTTSLTGSPIGPITIIVLGIVIAIIISSTIVALRTDWNEVIESIFTKKSTNKTITETHHPDCTTEYKETEEESTEPAIVPFGTGVIVIIAVVGLLLLFLVGFPRRRK